MRRAPSVDALLPALYLKGISTGDFTEALTQARKRAPRSGYYFVNIGEGPHRNWEDCMNYGFLAAGQGEKYSNALKKLKPGDLLRSVNARSRLATGV